MACSLLFGKFSSSVSESVSGESCVASFVQFTMSLVQDCKGNAKFRSIQGFPTSFKCARI